MGSTRGLPGLPSQKLFAAHDVPYHRKRTAMGAIRGAAWVLASLVHATIKNQRPAPPSPQNMCRDNAMARLQQIDGVTVANDLPDAAVGQRLRHRIPCGSHNMPAVRVQIQSHCRPPPLKWAAADVRCGTAATKQHK
jgi:hypothetical protein